MDKLIITIFSIILIYFIIIKICRKYYFVLGELSFQNGEMDKSIIHYKKACKLGDGLSCSVIGLNYSGNKISPDMNAMYYYSNDEIAIKYFERSCKLGNARGCFGLGRMYEHSGDYDKARQYYQKSCSMETDGSALACLHLGHLYKDGKGTEVNYKKAETYYNQSSDLDPMVTVPHLLDEMEREKNYLIHGKNKTNRELNQKEKEINDSINKGLDMIIEPPNKSF